MKGVDTRYTTVEAYTSDLQVYSFHGSIATGRNWQPEITPRGDNSPPENPPPLSTENTYPEDGGNLPSSRTS